MAGIDVALVARPGFAPAWEGELEHLARTVLRVAPPSTMDADFATGDGAVVQPAVVLFEMGLDRLLQVARAARKQWPAASLVFLSDERGDAGVRRALGAAPMLGKDWHVLHAEQGNLPDEVVRIAAVARRQRQFRSTIDEANLRLQSSRAIKGTQHRKLEVVDSYLASFLSYAQDAIIGVDADRNIVFCSAGAQRLLALTRAEVVGRPAAVLPIFSAALQEAMTRAALDHAVTTLESEVVVAGAAMTMEIVITTVVGDSDEVLGLTLVLRDITMRRIALNSERDAALQSGQRANAERRHLRQLFQHAPGFVLVTEGSSHRIELANEGFFELTATKQLVGHEVRAVVPQALADTIAPTMDAVYADGLPRAIADLAITDAPGSKERSPGQQRHVDFVFQPLLDNAGAVTGVFCQGHDVTRKVHAEAALQRSQRALEQALAAQATELHSTQRALEQSQKLEAIGKLTGGVAHDFNNVLQVIGANLQLLRRAMAGDQAPLKRIASALEAVDRGAKLSSQLLAFARKQPLAPQALDLGRRLRAMDDLLRRALGESIEIEISVSARLWTTMADPHQLENVVLNLALNARDAMPQGGKLTIEASNAMLDEAYAASESEVTAGAYVLLAVSDTGHGMSAETLAHAFDPFFTTKGEGEGTGLGLSMAYGFAKQSNGHIKLYSEVGSGTTVRLYLPRTLQKLDADKPFEPETVVGGDETILVAEDDPGVQATVVATLEDLGYRVLRANDASAALAILQSGARVDLLFTDVVMPGPLRSPELVKKAKALLPGIAVLYTSGYTQNAIVHGGRLDPGVELLSKPYRQDQLAKRLRTLLGPPHSRLDTKSAAALECTVVEDAVTAGVSRILLVEDDPALLDLTSELLGFLGCQVHGVGSAEMALEVLEGGGQGFDVLFTDLGLPGMSGAALAERVAGKHPGTKLVLVSGADAESAAAALMVSTGQDAWHLTKPYELGQLEALMRLLERS